METGHSIVGSFFVVIMDSSQKIETNGLPLNGDQPRTVIDYAEWPRDAPSVLERNVITIICGNTRLHWALHEGCVNKFIPIMFWQYVIREDLSIENHQGIRRIPGF